MGRQLIHQKLNRQLRLGEEQQEKAGPVTPFTDPRLRNLQTYARFLRDLHRRQLISFGAFAQETVCILREE